MRLLKKKNLEDADDARLIQETKKGNDEAFDIFVTRHRARVLRLVRGMVADREEAYDLSQEAFVKAYKSIPRFRGDSSPWTWLNRIVINICVDWQRRQKVRNRLMILVSKKDDSPSLEEMAVDGAWEADPSTVLESRKMKEITKKTLDSLPPKQRAAFVLRHYEGLSTKEVAQTLECAEGTAKVHLHRATARMRKALQPFAKEML